MGKIARYLNELIVGNVFDSPEILSAYATDRSVIEIKPKAVALPESTEDVRKLMRFCNQLAIKNIKTSVSVRGSGLDEMGADLGEGIIISTEKLNRLLEADRRERLVRVQAGITLRELNTALSLYGLTIPVGGHDAETIGGLISNCPTDTYAGKYGGIMRFVKRIEIVMASGDILQTNRLSSRVVEKIRQEKTAEGKIYRKITDLLKNHAETIEKIKSAEQSAAGYPNVAKLMRKETLDLMPLFFGAQGTLGIITEVILRAVPIRHKTARVVGVFQEFGQAQDFLEAIKILQPKQLDLYDGKIFSIAKNQGKKLAAVGDKVEDSFVVLAKFDQRINRCLKKIEELRKNLPRTSQLVVESSENKNDLDEIENSLILFLQQVRSGERVPIMVDFSLPNENLLKFLDDLMIVEKSLKLELNLFGSYATRNYSLRPKFDITEEDFAKQALAFLRALAFVIERQGGSLVGGAPEGRLKAIVTNASPPEAEKELYLAIKKIFDPREILNADIKLQADAKFTVKHFRTTEAKKTVL